jgi:hypothetical protein
MAVKERGFIVEFTLAGLATSGACIGSNPMEVVKTRMQLQVGLFCRPPPPDFFFFSYLG